LKDANMRFGILGSGLMSGKPGTIFAKAGHDVVFRYARNQRKWNRLARQAGRRASALSDVMPAGGSTMSRYKRASHVAADDSHDPHSCP